MCQSFFNQRQRDRLALTTILLPTNHSISNSETSGTKETGSRPTESRKRKSALHPASSCAFTPELLENEPARSPKRRNWTKPSVRFNVPNETSTPSSTSCFPDYGWTPEPMGMMAALQNAKARHPAVLEDSHRHENVLQYIDVVLNAQIDQWANGSSDPNSLAALANKLSEKDSAEALYEGLQIHTEVMN